MTGNNIVLDTNIVVELFRGNPDIIQQLGDLPAVKIPSFVLGELLLTGLPTGINICRRSIAF